MDAQSTTAFVLAGGGSLGAVEVGMLRALAAAGVRPDLIVGASAGAINGAHFAGDPSVAGVAKLEQIWRHVNRRDVMPLGWRDLLRIALRRDYWAVTIESGVMRRVGSKYFHFTGFGCSLYLRM